MTNPIVSETSAPRSFDLLKYPMILKTHVTMPSMICYTITYAISTVTKAGICVTNQYPSPAAEVICFYRAQAIGYYT